MVNSETAAVYSAVAKSDARNLPSLLDLLDPGRDYGDRSFEQVVDGIKSGEIVIESGWRLPVLRDAKTNRAIKGTGRPPTAGVSVQQAALREFRERAIEDLPEAYDILFAGMKAGDPRWGKIYWEITVGKMGEMRGGDAMAVALKLLYEAMQEPETRWIESSG